MKILHVITSLRTGGAEHLLVDLLPRLRDKGNDVELLLFDGTRTPFYDQLEQAGIIIHHLSIGGNVYNPLHIFRLVKYLKGYDIVHTHNTACQLFVAIASVLCSAVLVITEHNTSNRRRDWRCYAPIDRWMYRQYKRIICISNQAEENLRKIFYNDTKNRITTIYNGINTDSFIKALPTEDLKSEFSGKHIITMVAGFRYQKDHATLIKAMSFLSDDYILLLVGSGGKESECKALAKELNLKNRVHFLGMRTDIPQVLKATTIVALSSHFEGLSLSSIEGMASGRPFIASDVDGLREVVKGYGVLFPQGDAQSLANEIQKLCHDSEYYRQVAYRCQERAKQFDISNTVDSYALVYDELLPSASHLIAKS